MELKKSDITIIILALNRMEITLDHYGDIIVKMCENPDGDKKIIELQEQIADLIENFERMKNDAGGDTKS